MQNFDEQIAHLGVMIKTANINLLKGVSGMPKVKLPEIGTSTTMQLPGIPKLNKSKNPKYVHDMKDNSPYNVK